MIKIQKSFIIKMRLIEFKLLPKGTSSDIKTQQEYCDSFQACTFPSNYVKTTKYTVFSFLPVSLMLQLKNVIHIFFLFNGFLQTIPSISTNSPLASWVPVFWTMSMGMIFELIADIRRWNSDKKVNSYKVDMAYEDGGKI